MSVIPVAWLPKVPMTGIVGHWTAGGHKANSTDIKAYHVLFEGDGNVVRGVDIARNSPKLLDGYAAHTAGANTNRIGASMCGMMGAVENPFNPGPAPLTKIQWDKFVAGTAEMAKFYGIPISERTTLFHAEVEATLGIKQKNKWDIVRLAFDPSVVGAKAVGNKWRGEMRSYLDAGTYKPDPIEPIPAGGIARVTVDSLNFRRGPGTGHESTGSLPKNTTLEVLATEGDWIQVRTPGGFTGWVNRNFVQMVDGPQPFEPTVPDPRRELLSEIREKLDRIEQLL